MKFAGYTLEEIQKLLDSYDPSTHWLSEYQNGLREVENYRINNLCREILQDVLYQMEETLP